MTVVPEPSWQAVYEAAVARADIDAVHDLIARHGTAILDRGLPYVLVAARNRIRDTQRQAGRRREHPFPAGEPVDPRQPIDDALGALKLSTAEERLARALDRLGDREVVLLWGTAR